MLYYDSKIHLTAMCIDRQSMINYIAYVAWANNWHVSIRWIEVLGTLLFPFGHYLYLEIAGQAFTQTSYDRIIAELEKLGLDGSEMLELDKSIC